MISERTEFLISQYVDGTLDADQRIALEAELAANADARALADAYRKLNTRLAALPAPPEVDFAALTGRINDAIDQRNTSTSYRLPFANPRSLTAIAAVAACLLIATGVWFGRLASPPSSPTLATGDHAAHRAQRATIQVAVLQPEDARLEYGPALQDIRIGPPADDSYSYVLSEALVTRPNTLFIAKAAQPAQDTSQSLY